MSGYYNDHPWDKGTLGDGRVFMISTPGLLELATMVDGIPPAIAGGLAELNIEMLSNARNAIIKEYKGPGGNSAKAMLGASIHRYGSKNRAPVNIAEATGEIFAAGGGFGKFGQDILVMLQNGRTVTASGMMAVPIGAGRVRKGGGWVTSANFKRLLAERKLNIVQRPGKNPLLVFEGNKQTSIYGVLVRRRVQPKQLTFYESFEARFKKHEPYYERLVQIAMDASALEALEARLPQASEVQFAAYAAKMSELTNNGERRTRTARRIAARAGRLARRQFVLGAGSGAAA